MDRRAQSGITLVVSLIMLIVLTLLVVSAIRFGNINLRIAGNAQSQAEAEAATQAALEQTIALVKLAPKIDSIPARTVEVSTGGATYKVNVSVPTCKLNTNVVTTQLDPSLPQDQACFGGGNGDIQYDSTGKPIPQPTECKDQNWEISAAVDTATSQGSSMTIVQGMSVRVGSEVTCPAGS